MILLNGKELGLLLYILIDFGGGIIVIQPITLLEDGVIGAVKEIIRVMK